MIQTMIERLDGFAPLQLKILYYCLGTHSAKAMALVISIVKERSLENPDLTLDQQTAWRFYELKSGTSRRRGDNSFRGWVTYQELRVAKTTYAPDKTREAFVLLKTSESHVLYMHALVTNKETTHGTPTGVIMRNYLSKLFNAGIKLEDCETLWARFSCCQILTKKCFPMVNLNKDVRADLNNAMRTIIIRRKSRDNHNLRV